MGGGEGEEGGRKREDEEEREEGGGGGIGWRGAHARGRYIMYYTSHAISE